MYQRSAESVRAAREAQCPAAGALALELAEEALALPAAEFPLHLLRRLEPVLGFDSAICVALQPGIAGASLNKGQFLKLLRLYQQNRGRYEGELARGRKAAKLDGGAYLDTEVFSAAERRELPFFVDILQPQGIKSQLVGFLHLRDRPLAAIHLCRHGHGSRFDERELQLLRGVIPVATLALAASGAAEPGPMSDPLTAREREIARHVAAGLGNRDIAHHLGSSPHTVRNQLHAVFEKLGITRRAELAAWVERQRLGIRPGSASGASPQLVSIAKKHK